VTDDQRQTAVYSWGGSVGFALIGTAIVVGLILLFTALESLVGDFWAQVIYFPTIFLIVAGAAVRSRRLDSADPSRLTRPAAITPAGLPGPFVITQALGVAGIVMVIAGLIVGGSGQVLWIASGYVCLLVGGVGLLFWLSGKPWQRRSSV
jgi:hypothetical protein